MKPKNSYIVKPCAVHAIEACYIRNFIESHVGLVLTFYYLDYSNKKNVNVIFINSGKK